MINPNIFRAYDIRGFYPQEINEQVALSVGYALAVFLQKKYQRTNLTLVVGRDGRNSSSELSLAAVKGMLGAGVKVIDVGLVPTPLFYFGVWHYGFDGGIYVTASHNPSQYNGFKLVQKDSRLIAANTGIDEVRFLSLQSEKKEQDFSSLKWENYTQKEVMADYIHFVLQDYDLPSIKPFSLTVDCGNGAMSVLMPSFLSNIPGSFHTLFCEIDGSFPNHLPDPSQKDNLHQLIQLVQNTKSDLGVAFDGDGDRVGFVDERGEVISSNLVSAFLVKTLARKDDVIVYNLMMSRIVSDTAQMVGARALMTRVGFTFVKEQAIAANAILGAETSGHYCLQNNHFCEAPLFVWLTILEQMCKTGKKASELFAEFQKYQYEGPFSFEVHNKEKILQRLEQKYSNGKVSQLDGLRVDFDDWWFNVRPSNTENFLRCVIEAKDRETLQEKKKEIISIIESDAS